MTYIVSIICIIFGLGFSAVGIYNFDKAGILMIILPNIFTLVGIYLLYQSFTRTKVLKMMKALRADPTAHQTTGKYHSHRVFSRTSKRINGYATSYKVYYRVTYEYTDENGNVQQATDPNDYLISQVEYLQGKESFPVKCKDGLSVIDEDIPKDHGNYSL